MKNVHKSGKSVEISNKKHRIRKKLLTNRNKSVNIIKLSDEDRKEGTKELEKSSKKYLTKSKRCDTI